MSKPSWAWLEGEEFYKICNYYRHVPVDYPLVVKEAFKDLKIFIRDAEREQREQLQDTASKLAHEVAKLEVDLAAEREKNAALQQRYEKLALSESLLECDYADLENQIVILKAELAKLRQGE